MFQASQPVSRQVLLQTRYVGIGSQELVRKSQADTMAAVQMEDKDREAMATDRGITTRG